MYAYVNENYKDESISSEKSCDELQESYNQTYNQTYNQSNIKPNEKFVTSHTKQRLYCISKRKWRKHDHNDNNTVQPVVILGDSILNNIIA